ncbi:hypothetical protein LWC34_33465 [Kibdelosporangium philippinense]|uniref:Secreted protein n=1 Tax=Kibdelosporangium philippinense TaxID=211113 RepID=A0ABS8ZIS2_9PSEU|nr:hypothetical protein [Kibdelosporangium philippinense]MCE7007695.1 hypothetical protein [Kibdelosporangium philippinense]
MRRIITAISLLVLLGACGSNGSAAPTSLPAEPTDQLQQFAKCMRDNGIDVPDPAPDGGWDEAKIDRDSPAFKKATEACKQFLPGGGDLSKLDPELIEQMRQMTQCLRDNGVDVPDPDPNSPDLGIGALQGIDRDSPAVKKAMEACKDKIPGRVGK